MVGPSGNKNSGLKGVAQFMDLGLRFALAILISAGGGYWLEDTNSCGGTFFNDERLIAGRHRLQDGDQIHLGSGADASTAQFIEELPAP